MPEGRQTGWLDDWIGSGAGKTRRSLAFFLHSDIKKPPVDGYPPCSPLLSVCEMCPDEKFSSEAAQMAYTGTYRQARLLPSRCMMTPNHRHAKAMKERADDAEAALDELFSISATLLLTVDD